MEIIAMVKKISSLFFALTCGTVYAECTVPEKITHKDFLAAVSNAYSPENPMADQVFRMKFLDNGNYFYQTLKDGKNYSGTYTYEVVKKNISVIHARENYQSVPVEYTMTLVCSHQTSGSYIYQQIQGINDVRANFGRYFLMTEMD